MQIQDVTRGLEQSLASLKSLTASALPPVLEGLRHLPMGGYEPRVSIRHWNVEAVQEGSAGMRMPATSIPT